MQDKIFGRNPVIEALKSDREIDKILIKKGGTDPRLKSNSLTHFLKVKTTRELLRFVRLMNIRR